MGRRMPAKFKAAYVASAAVPQRSVDNVLLEKTAAPERRFALYLSFVLHQGCGFNFVTTRVRRGSLQRVCSVLFL